MAGARTAACTRGAGAGAASSSDPLPGAPAPARARRSQWAASLRRPASAKAEEHASHWYRLSPWLAVCPISTGRGTRRVRLVRREGGGG